MNIAYLHLPPGGAAPALALNPPFAAIVIAETEVSDEWRNGIARWLVDNRCLYMMAWGRDASQWHDAVDGAHLEAFDFGDVPEDKFVITTSHEGESLEETLWFATHIAHHPTVNLQSLLLLDIAPQSREVFLLGEASRAGAG